MSDRDLRLAALELANEVLRLVTTMQLHGETKYNILIERAEQVSDYVQKLEADRAKGFYDKPKRRNDGF